VEDSEWSLLCFGREGHLEPRKTRKITTDSEWSLLCFGREGHLEPRKTRKITKLLKGGGVTCEIALQNEPVSTVPYRNLIYA
jgi:hypothetical protein